MKIGSLFDGSGSPPLGEEWRPVKGFESAYLVSTSGVVWSIRRKIQLTGKKSKAGYLRVCLSENGRQRNVGIHRLVAEAFIPNPEQKPTVNHINEDKADNRLENLEWATHREQNLHGTRIARAVANTDWKARTAKMDYAAIAKKHDYSKINAAQMKRVARKDRNGVVQEVFDSIGQAARSANASTGGIWACCNGKRKTCKGSAWSYA